MSIWHIPTLSATAPQIAVQNAGYGACADAQRLVAGDAAVLGFANSALHCDRGGIATLDRTSASKPVSAARIVDFNDFDRLTATPRIQTGFEVPEQIPFAAATSTIVAHVPLDELFVAIRVDDLLGAAFALENAGISRSDITNTRTINNLLVRVRPISEEQVRRIVDIVKVAQPHNEPVAYVETGFIRDCTAVYASLTQAAIEDAHRRALVMARAANVRLGNVLGVVDAGGSVADTVCGSGREPSINEAAGLVQPGYTGNAADRVDMTVPVEATVVRRLSAAWRLQLPPNPHGFYYRYLTRLRNGLPFVANGLQSEGDELAANSLHADIVTILLPAPAYAMVKHSPYAPELTYADIGSFGPLYEAIRLHARSEPGLERSIESLRAYVSSASSGSPPTKGWRYAFASDNCHSPLDGALFNATRNAIARAGNKPIRYLEQLDATTTNIACTLVPAAQEIGPLEMWSDSSAPPGAGAMASVIAGY